MSEAKKNAVAIVIALTLITAIGAVLESTKDAAKNLCEAHGGMYHCAHLETVCDCYRPDGTLLLSPTIPR